MFRARSGAFRFASTMGRARSGSGRGNGRVTFSSVTVQSLPACNYGNVGLQSRLLIRMAVKGRGSDREATGDKGRRRARISLRNIFTRLGDLSNRAHAREGK